MSDFTFLTQEQFFEDDKLDIIKFVGLNAGTLGFFLDYNTSEIDSLLNDIKNENFDVINYPLVEASVTSKKTEKTIYAVNEIRIESPYHSLVCDVNVNDRKLESYSGNGLIVCTSLGSSAYNKSLGGALIQHDLPLLELTEVASIQSSVYRSLASSLIVDGTNVISFAGQLKDILVGYDHECYKCENIIQNIKITLSNKKVNLVRKVGHDYIDVIHRAFICNKER